MSTNKKTFCKNEKPKKILISKISFGFLFSYRDSSEDSFCLLIFQDFLFWAGEGLQTDNSLF